MFIYQGTKTHLNFLTTSKIIKKQKWTQIATIIFFDQINKKILISPTCLNIWYKTL